MEKKTEIVKVHTRERYNYENVRRERQKLN